MTLHLTLHCDNAAFGDCRESALAEAGRILRHAGSRLADGFILDLPYQLKDANGNHVGDIEEVQS